LPEEARSAIAIAGFKGEKRPEYVHFRCDKTLGKKCNVSVIFTPGAGSPQSISLSGMGKAAKKK